MFNDDSHDQGATLVATFPSHDAAHRAVQDLHDDGFHRTWIGTMRAPEGGYGDAATSGAPVVESDNALARFFGSADESLHDALVKHGVGESDAARIDGTLPVGSAIVTVHGENHPERAVHIFSAAGGQLVTSPGASRLYDVYGDKDAPTPGLSQDRLATLGDYHGGDALEEPRRLQLREERLSINKGREQTGEATVGTRVVTQTTDVDVPVYHEELFIERRPASGSYGDAGTIGDGATIRVPLERETVSATKQTVVTEEVAVGQRRVEGVEHVSETLKKEELDVRDDRSV